MYNYLFIYVINIVLILYNLSLAQLKEQLCAHFIQYICINLTYKKIHKIFEFYNIKLCTTLILNNF